ncbi:MAG: hypothetical protein QXU39_02465 [Candidatus Pacearchaeota archaeon]
MGGLTLNDNFNYLEKKTEEEFYKSIGGYIEHPKYKEIFKCLNLVLESKKIHGLALDGGYGIGKSTIIKGYLKKINKKFFYINSYTTSLSFYIQVYKNRDKIILLDDLSGLWEDEKGISILRAMLNNEKIRYVNYLSTSEKLKCPSSFIFKGKIIILCNNLNKHIEETTKSRMIYRKLNFSYKEKIELMNDILKHNYNFNDEDLKKITEFILKNVDETNLDFNFRTLLKIAEFYIKYPLEWENLSLKEIPKDKNLILIRELQKKYSNTNQRVQEFIKITGKSRASYFNYLKKYKEIKGDPI